MFTLFLVLHYAAGSLQGNNKKMHYLCGQLLSVLPMHMKIYAELGRRAPARLFPTTCANTRANFRRVEEQRNGFQALSKAKSR